MIKADLHIHTYHSPDSLATPDDIMRWARRRGIDRVAITDHDTIAAALEMHRRWPESVIVGEEIKTDRGEIIGLFLSEEVPAGLSPAETIRCIREQRGVVYIPHPMDRIRGSALAYDALLDVVDSVDVIETLNARVTLADDNRFAAEFAQDHNLPQAAGSDAHSPSEVGRAYTEMLPFMTAPDFVYSIRGACAHGRVSSPLVHLGSTYARVAKSIMAALSATR